MKKSNLLIHTKNKTITYTVYMPAEEGEYTAGLSSCKSLPCGEGMLFDFSGADHAIMTMRDMHIPLDFVFIEEDGRISKIVENATPQRDTLFAYASVKAVLELNAGECKKNGIKVLDTVTNVLFKESIQDSKIYKDISFHYHLNRAGWAESSLVVGDNAIHMPAISYISSPITDLLDALLTTIEEYTEKRFISKDLLIPNRVSSFCWDGESEAWFWKLKTFSNGALSIKISHLKDAFGPKEDRIYPIVVLDKVVDLHAFLKAIIKELDRLLKKEGFVHFKSKWDSSSPLQFPISEFLLIKYYIVNGKALKYVSGGPHTWGLQEEFALINTEIA